MNALDRLLERDLAFDPVSEGFGALPPTGPAYPWQLRPKGYQTVDPFGSGAMPAIGASLLALSFPIGVGWDGVISRLSFNQTNAAFIPGSGALLFTVDIDGTPLRGFVNVPVEIGELGSPRKIDDALINSGQTINFTLKNVSLAPAANIFVVASFGGYLWQRGL